MSMESINTIRTLEHVEDCIKGFLLSYITAQKFEEIVAICLPAFKALDEIGETVYFTLTLSELVKKGEKARCKKIIVKKILKILSNRLRELKEECIEPKKNDALDINFQRLLDIEVAHLQLNLIEQKCFYSVLNCKSKIDVQKDILIASAIAIQRLTQQESIVESVKNQLGKLQGYKSATTVSEEAESIIANCYALLLDTLNTIGR